MLIARDETDIYKPDLKDIISALVQKGLAGTRKDFFHWIEMYRHIQQIRPTGKPLLSVTEAQVADCLESMLKSSEVVDNGKGYNELIAPSLPKFSDQVSYYILGDLKFAPLQFIRSRLEAFLYFYQISLDDLTDISIGVIEAAENAVKYGSHDLVSVEYGLKDNTFHIKMVNRVTRTDTVENSIEEGKFSEEFTLMRGIMAMNKLFDQFDIDRDDKEMRVSFTASKKVRR